MKVGDKVIIGTWSSLYDDENDGEVTHIYFYNGKITALYPNQSRCFVVLDEAIITDTYRTSGILVSYRYTYKLR